MRKIYNRRKYKNLHILDDVFQMFVFKKLIILFVITSKLFFIKFSNYKILYQTFIAFLF